ncbi:MAG: methyl-accepting chemotaxis protein [Cyanobacteria bacterium J06621_8]
MTQSAPVSHRTLPSEAVSPQKLIAASWWQRQGIRFKTTFLAIALGTLPTLAVGSISYFVAAQDLEQQSINLRQTLVADLQNQVNIFMSDRLNDIEMMATLPILSDPKLRSITTAGDKSAALQSIQDAYGFYSSIAVFDAQGDLVAKTEGESLGNYLNREYIQAAIATDGAVISQPLISTNSGTFCIYTAAPIKDRQTGATIGFIRAKMPVTELKKIIQDNSTEGGEYYLLDDQGQVFLGSAGEYLVTTKSDGSQAQDQPESYSAIPATAIFDQAEELLNSSGIASKMVLNRQTNRHQFLAYAPVKPLPNYPSLNWQSMIATDRAVVLAPQNKLRLVFVLGTGLMALGVGGAAYLLADRFLRPLLQATRAVREIGRGVFTTRVAITGTDEIAQLGDDINNMAIQLAELVETLTVVVQQSESLAHLTFKLSQGESELEVVTLALQASRQTFQPMRAAYYQFTELNTIAIVAEVTAPGQAKILQTKIAADQLQEQLPLEVMAVNDVSQEDLPLFLKQHLESLAVQSCLIAPVFLETELDGWLIIHQSSNTHDWLDEELKFMTQIASQVELALTRLKFLQQQQQAKTQAKSAQEELQIRALSLLQEVYDVSEGDLTIRAQVTEDEIGTIADSYNSTIESLQKLVNQTKSAAIEVHSNTEFNNQAIQSLAQETMVQATAINQMLEQVKGMEQSIKLVATQADRAEQFVQQATVTINGGDQAMNRTVAEINTVQQTITQTALKAEKLGESSQEISQAVNLISRFAAQTHLLALKASIEAARAGEEGKGFAVIADEVRSLATQSADATAEIETLVNKIQLETGEVVTEMNQGAEQIASGNELVQQSRHSLTQISQVSQEISQLVSSITQATQEHSATSAAVTQTIFDIAEIAQNNSQGASQVSESIQQLSAIADKLQSAIAKFKT